METETARQRSSLVGTGGKPRIEGSECPVPSVSEVASEAAAAAAGGEAEAAHDGQGLVNHCIENLFLEQVFLLNHLDEDDAGITVQVNEEGLHLMYCGILQQEGTLFARFTGKLLQDLTDGEPHLKYNDVVIVDTPTTGSHWIVQSLSNASKAQVAKSSLEPLIPFSQPADVVLDEELNSLLKLQGHKEANFITFLDKILETESSTVFKMGMKKGTLQEGAIYNLHAIALRHIGSIKHAMDSYHKAQQICELLGSRQNHAVVQANLGFLCITAKFMGLAELYLTKSVKLFSEQQNNIFEIHFIKVLLEVGLYYVGQNLKDKAKFFYEWALLIAIMGNHNESQLQAAQLLCYFYREVCPNEAQCIIYSEYLLLLAQKTGDKVLEGETLETISQLYFGLGTERSFVLYQPPHSQSISLINFQLSTTLRCLVLSLVSIAAMSSENKVRKI
ncbi:S3TC1 protein, partial [Polypterus senegalus]